MLFGWQYQCNRLPGKTRLHNDLLYVKWDVKPYTLTHSPDIHVGGLIFYRDSSFFLVFVSYPRSSQNGTQPYPATWSEVSVISLSHSGLQCLLHNVYISYWNIGSSLFSVILSTELLTSTAAAVSTTTTVAVVVCSECLMHCLACKYLHQQLIKQVTEWLMLW